MRSGSCSVASPFSVTSDGEPGVGGGPAHGVLHHLGPELVAHLGQACPGAGSSRPGGPEHGALVALHADEVVAGVASRKVFSRICSAASRGALAALAGHELLHRQGDAHRERPGPDAQGVHRQAVGPDQGLVHGEVAGVLVLHARGVDADGVAQHGHHVGLVEGAGPSDEVTEVGDGALDVAGEALGRVGRLPPAAVGEPTGRREVVEGHDRRDAALVAGRAHAPVVVEGGEGELPLGGLDPAPFQREAVGAEAEVGHQADVLGASGGRSRRRRRSTRRTRRRGCAPTSHQSLLVLPPSIWWAEVAVPHRNPGRELGGACVVRPVGHARTVARPCRR